MATQVASRSGDFLVTSPTSQVQPTNRLRVLQMSARADMGGGPRHLFDLLQGLRDSNVVNYVACPLDEPWGPKFRDMAAGFIEIPHRRFSIVVLFALARYVRAHSIDVIHSHGRGAGYYSRFLGLLTRRPVVHTYHGVFVEKPLAARLKLFADRCLAFLPFFGLFVSSSEKADAQRAGVIRNQRDAILPNAVDLARFEQVAHDRQPTIRRIGCFLRPTKQKGPDLLLALAASCAGYPWATEVTFECAGIGPDQLAQFGAIPSNVIAKGVVLEPVRWLAELDLFVSTARHEGLPIGVLEAMAAGTPCLLSQIPAHEQFFAAKVASPLDLRKPFGPQIQATLANTPALIAGATRARTYIHDGFSLGAFSKQLVSIYENVLRTWTEETRD